MPPQGLSSPTRPTEAEAAKDSPVASPEKRSAEEEEGPEAKRIRSGEDPEDATMMGALDTLIDEAEVDIRRAAYREQLDPDLIREGRQEERGRLSKYVVYQRIRDSEVAEDDEVVDARWVDQKRVNQYTGEVKVRSRIVARQFANE